MTRVPLHSDGLGAERAIMVHLNNVYVHWDIGLIIPVA